MFKCLMQESFLNGKSPQFLAHILVIIFRCVMLRFWANFNKWISYSFIRNRYLLKLFKVSKGRTTLRSFIFVL